MKKLTKITSAALAGLMMLSAVPAMSASAKTVVKKPKVTVENTGKGVKVSWSKAKGAKKYVVMRKLSSAKKYTALKTVNKAKAGSFVDKKAKAGKTYKYTVKAYSGTVSATSKAQKIVRLEAPTITDRTDENGIHFDWNGVKGAKKFEVYCAEVVDGKTGKYKLADTLSWAEYEEWKYSNAVLKYKVRAVNGKSYSPFSNVLKIDYVESPMFLEQLNSDYSAIQIQWYPVQDIEGYRIYRIAGEGQEELIADLKAEDCILEENALGYIYTDANVTEGVFYTYSMEAYDGDRVSIKYTSLEPLEFKTAEYTVKVGETNTELATEFLEYKEMIESSKVTVVFSSEDESIFTLDENYNIIGVSVGKANIVCTMKYEENGTNMVITTKAPVKVTE